MSTDDKMKNEIALKENIKNLLKTVRLTREFLVGADLKSTRQRQIPSSYLCRVHHFNICPYHVFYFSVLPSVKTPPSFSYNLCLFIYISLYIYIHLSIYVLYSIYQQYSYQLFFSSFTLCISFYHTLYFLVNIFNNMDSY